MGCQSNTPTEISAESDFKVIGYIRGNSKQFSQGLEAQLPYITHLNYSFINPTDDATGAIKPFNQARFNEFVERGKAANKSLFVSFGGWRKNEDSFDSVYERIAANPVARKIFIDNIVQMTLDYDLDGVDMDWEYPRIEKADEYADFIEALAQALHAHDKLLTAAVIGVESKVTDSGHADAYLDRAIAAFDWINLMAYDERTDDHAPYSAATNSIDYWVNQRGVPPHKAVLGLPIYARPSWRGFAEVISEDPLLACVDTTVYNGKTDYYNGLPMIAKKTRLAQNEQLAGVMVWELPLDSTDPVTSIMKQIVDTAFHGDPKTICDR
jgi:GH18 family chitinase